RHALGHPRPTRPTTVLPSPTRHVERQLTDPRRREHANREDELGGGVFAGEMTTSANCSVPSNNSCATRVASSAMASDQLLLQRLPVGLTLKKAPIGGLTPRRHAQKDHSRRDGVEHRRHSLRHRQTLKLLPPAASLSLRIGEMAGQVHRTASRKSELTSSHCTM